MTLRDQQEIEEARTRARTDLLEILPKNTTVFVVFTGLYVSRGGPTVRLRTFLASVHGEVCRLDRLIAALFYPHKQEQEYAATGSGINVQADDGRVLVNELAQALYGDRNALSYLAI